VHVSRLPGVAVLPPMLGWLVILPACEGPAQPRVASSATTAPSPPRSAIARESTSAAFVPPPPSENREGLVPVSPIESVARAHVAESQACWHAAYARRGPDAGEVAKVTVFLRVSGGSVHDVTSTGDPPGYPGLATCIIENVARWRFSPTLDFPVQLPFVYGPPPRTLGDGRGPY
jgi:hypothetical protein